jgi:glycosyltransferase involved in cell wall biosynthesis
VKISFLCFDLSENSLGRAALLARTLARHHPVTLVGPAKQETIWFPLRDLGLPTKTFPWKRYPSFVSVIRQMMRAMDGDVLFACKLRPTSFGVGLLKKWISGKPLIVDIDDWELGFYYRAGFWGRVGRFLNFSNPNGLPHTWLMERLVNFADEITVSNKFLENRFSGTLLYHCRDTTILDPEKFDADRAKEKLGVKNKKVVMFLGTPRKHKGVDDLVLAMNKIDDPDVRLVIIGADDGVKSFSGDCLMKKDQLVVLPMIPFKDLPEHLAAADVVVIPQRDTSDTVGQMPAKIFDAMAMAKPIVSTRVSDIPEVLGDTGYLVDPGNVEQLASAINHVFSHPEEARLKGKQARERCIARYDIKGMEKQLLELVEKVRSKKNSD